MRLHSVIDSIEMLEKMLTRMIQVEHQKSCCDKVQQVVQRSEEMCKSSACHYVENLSNGSALEVLPTAKNGVWRVKLLIDLRLGNCLWLEWKTRVLVRSHCQISTNKSNWLLDFGVISHIDWQKPCNWKIFLKKSHLPQSFNFNIYGGCIKSSIKESNKPNISLLCIHSNMNC